ncbi:MAG: phage tail protein [Ruminococcus flavefaciens]|nr:phage tail protein [Ruminococcus flavefaciens]MCM1060565.1 phage tail protein [Eubacterium sp.]
MYKITISNGISEKVLHEPDTLSRNRLSSGQFSEEVNQIPSFDFTIPVSNPYYSEELNDRKDVVTIMNTLTNEIEFEGTLLTHSDSMSSGGKLEKTAVCEGFLGYLCDSIQPYHHYENYTIVEFLRAVLERHNAIVSEEKRIYLGSCDFSGDNTNSKTTAYRSTLEEIRINLTERVGGEMRIRKVDGKLILDFLTQYGTKSNTAIELAKNMKSLDVKIDSTNIITRLIPLGYQLNNGETAERLDISSVNDGKMYIDDDAAIEKYGIIVGTAEFDNITLPENLLKAGKEYLKNNNRIRKAYEAQVLDLSIIDTSHENIRCGNTYRFVNRFMGLDEELRIMKRTVDIYKPYSPVIEIGDRAERITDISVRTAHLIEYELPQQKLDILASAKATATDLINAGINGYVVVNPNEILIMDTPDKETATKVWRWNSGGFGYSNTGYNGEYGTAMTMDGAIVADFITAGVLRGVEIVNGDGTFRVSPNGSVTASAINITGGSINISSSSEMYDIISLNCREWNHKLSPLEFCIINNAVGYELKAQAGGMWLSHNGETMIWMNAESGSISAQKVYGNDILIKLEDDDGYYSLRNFIENFRGRISALEDSEKTVFSDDIRFRRSDGMIYSLRDQIDLIHSNIEDLYRRVGGAS